MAENKIQEEPPLPNHNHRGTIVKKKTIPAIVEIHAGGLVPGTDMVHFSFKEQIPRHFVEPLHPSVVRGDHPALVDYTLSLVKKHENEVKNARDWKCHSCDKGCTSFYHSISFGKGLSTISPKKGVTKFEIRAVLVPLCESKGECDKKGEHLSFVYSIIKTPMQTNVIPTATCLNCFGKSGSKKCAACKIIGYCSKECQRQHWPYHKVPCQLLQADEKARSQNEASLRALESAQGEANDSDFRKPLAAKY